MTQQKVWAVILLLTLPAVASSQARPGICVVRQSWEKGGLPSANLPLVGSFKAEVSEEPTVKTFKDSDGSPTITGGVRYVYAFPPSGKPYPVGVRLAIAVSGGEESNLFTSIDSAEAGALYGKRWNLSVSKRVNFDDRVYTYTLKCENNPETRN